MSDSSRYFKAHNDNRQNRDPEVRSSYLRNFQQKQKQQKNQMQMIFKDTDQSIENILNNSMGHLDNVIKCINTTSQSLSIQDVMKQNAFLKDNIVKMKKILKQKLEVGLKKQRAELAVSMSGYTELITKLLQDKQQLTTLLRNTQSQKCRQNQYLNKINNLKQQNLQLKHDLDERDQHIRTYQIKLDELLLKIQQYEQDNIKQRQTMQEMVFKLQEQQNKNRNKQQSMSISYSDRKDNSDIKVQSLIQALQTSQLKNKQLKEEIKNLQRSKEDLRETYEQKIAVLNQENEEEFLQYQKAVRQTLDKKEDCIERLNAVVESLKRK